jgi:hypothetical protein
LSPRATSSIKQSRNPVRYDDSIYCGWMARSDQTAITVIPNTARTGLGPFVYKLKRTRRSCVSSLSVINTKYLCRYPFLLVLTLWVILKDQTRLSLVLWSFSPLGHTWRPLPSYLSNAPALSFPSSPLLLRPLYLTSSALRLTSDQTFITQPPSIPLS